MTFVLTPMPAPFDLTTAARTGLRRTVNEAHGYPCRRCLCDGEPGESVLLVSYDPFLGDSPYRCASPIYVHERDCSPGPLHPGVVPDQQRRRLLSIRAYDANHLLVDAEVARGSDAGSVFDHLLADERTDYLHVHNAKPGCFAVRVDRA